MSTPSAPTTLSYATELERELARARGVAGLVTGPAGLALLIVSSGQRLLQGLGLLCILAGVGWLMAASAGRRRARERAAWRLALDDERLSVTTPEGERRIPRERITSVTLDDDSLQVVVGVADAEELRLDATWGTLGAVDLHALLHGWWHRETSSSGRDN